MLAGSSGSLRISERGDGRITVPKVIVAGDCVGPRTPSAVLKEGDEGKDCIPALAAAAGCMTGVAFDLVPAGKWPDSFTAVFPDANVRGCIAGEAAAAV